MLAGFRPLNLAASKNAGIATFSVAATATTAVATVTSPLMRTANDATAAVVDVAKVGADAGALQQHVATLPAGVDMLTLAVQSINSEFAHLWPGHGNALAVGLIAWTALGPGAIASFLQTYGQASVPPAQTQVRITGILAPHVVSGFVLG